MARILLTGAGGFIGRNVKERLEKDGYDVISYDRKQDLQFYLYAKDIDCIINCAGAIKDRDNMIGTNLEFLERLLRLSQLFKVKKIIQIGSSSELGNVNFIRSENDVCVPTNLYQGTKAAATMLCQGYAGEYDMDIVVARPFTIYGKHEQKNRFISSLWDAFVNDKQFSLYPGSHDFISVEDFADGIVLLLSSEKHITQGQIFHFGTGISSSNEIVVKLFEKHLGKELNIVKHTSKYHAYDCDNWQASIEKVSKLGWTPKISLDEGIKKYIDFRWFSEETVNNSSH